MATQTQGLTWHTRATRRTTDVARERIWRSRCGRFKVVEARSHFGGIPTVYYAEVLRTVGTRPGWDIVSTHRRRDPAFRACQRHARTIADS